MHSIDSKTIVHEGITYHVEKFYDQDSTPADSECYSPAQIAAWKADDWQYVGLFVRVAGFDRTTGASLWGIEDGWCPTDIETSTGVYESTGQVTLDAFDHLDDYPDLFDEALESARKTAALVLA